MTTCCHFNDYEKIKMKQNNIFAEITDIFSFDAFPNNIWVIIYISLSLKDY